MEGPLAHNIAQVAPNRAPVAHNIAPVAHNIAPVAPNPGDIIFSHIHLPFTIYKINNNTITITITIPITLQLLNFISENKIVDASCGQYY